MWLHQKIMYFSRNSCIGKCEEEASLNRTHILASLTNEKKKKSTTTSLA